MDAPYREAQPLERRDVSDRLECWLRDGDKHRWVRALYVKLWITAAVCGFIIASGAVLATVPAAVAGMLWAASDYRKRKGAGVVFTVRSGRIEVARPHGGPLAFTFDEILDVRLDTKTTSKNLTVARADGVNTIFGAASAHNIDVDVSRIELHIEGREPVLIDREFISSSLCADELRAIRLFLRAHGWKPLDERAR